jgi:hypothetical protein
MGVGDYRWGLRYVPFRTLSPRGTFTPQGAGDRTTGARVGYEHLQENLARISVYDIEGNVYKDFKTREYDPK